MESDRPEEAAEVLRAGLQEARRFDLNPVADKLLELLEEVEGTDEP